MKQKPIGQDSDYVTAYMFLGILLVIGGFVVRDHFYSKSHPVVCSKEVTVQ